MLYLLRWALKLPALSSEALYSPVQEFLDMTGPGHGGEMCLQAAEHPEIGHLLFCLRVAASRRSIRDWQGKNEDS